MSQTTRRELIASIGPRYREARWDDKQRILDEFTAATGYHRKYAIAVLKHPPAERPLPTHRPRGQRYDAEVQAALMCLWEAAGGICGKRLVPFLPTLIEALERHGQLQLSAAIRARLLSISAATVDRLTREARQSNRGGEAKIRRGGGLLKHQIPVRTFADWDEPPGFCEVDLGLHCGRYLPGSYLQSLVLTDVASGWTECAALWVREQSLVVEAMKGLRQRLPIPLRGIDTANGSEFINTTLIDFCRTEGIRLTRSRPYKKNDQCFVEQKNGAVVRRWVGYDRYEGLDACTLLAELYAVLRRYINYFQPSMKLVHKVCTGARLTKTYDRAQTPCERLLASPEVAESSKAALRAEFHCLNPGVLLAEIERLQEALWRLAKPDLLPTSRLATQPGSDPTRCAQSQGAISPSIAPAETQTPKRRHYRRAQRPRCPHTWRTRSDPFAAVWEEIQAQLVRTPEITAKALLHDLQSKYPGHYTPGQLRTLHRRVSAWRKQQTVQRLTPHLPSNITLARALPTPELSV
jgi:hypothetical protein